jgi:hypothetical protein
MLSAVLYILFAVVVISLGVAMGVVIGGRKYGVSLHAPRRLVRFVLDERNGH